MMINQNSKNFEGGIRKIISNKKGSSLENRLWRNNLELTLLNKKGSSLAEGVQMLPRLVMVSLIALVVLGGSNVIYAYHVNVRTSEAMLMTRAVVDCLAPKGIVDLNLYKDNKDIFSICKINGGKMDRFFVNVSIRDLGGTEVLKLSGGDSGAIWIKKLFDGVKEKRLEGIKISKPGFFPGAPGGYDILFSDYKRGKMIVEVFVKDEK